MTYKINDNGIDRNMTEQETLEYETILDDYKAKEIEAKARAKAKADVIAKLGLTADEVTALLS
jgi:glycogen synthase